jgi:spermidine/putrescine transport system substrate-binding protein
MPDPTTTRRQALLAGAAGFLGLAAAGCGGQSGGNGRAATPTPAALAGKPVEDRLIMGNWVDFTSPENLKDFAAETGVKITQAGYGSEEELIAKMRTGGFKYDLVVPGTGGLEQLRDAGLLMELDHTLLPNLAHLQPAFAGDGPLAPDPRFGVAKDYGIASFFWRTAVVDDPPRTIADGFELLGRHRDARVNVIESSNELIALALAALGLSINSERDEDLDRARDLLIAAKPSIDTISTQYIERGQRGEIDIGIGYSGDVRRIQRARAKDGDAIELLIPDGPTEAFVDVWAIPANAPHPVAAHAWINYVLDPRNATRETEYIQFGSPVRGAEDPDTAIPDDALARFEIPSVLTPDGERKRARIFTEFKAA